MGAFIEAPHHNCVSLQGFYPRSAGRLMAVDLIECPTPARYGVVRGIPAQAIRWRDDDAFACEEGEFVALPVVRASRANASSVETLENALRFAIRCELVVPDDLLRNEDPDRR